VHLSKEQVAELVAPHPETLGLVNSWLEHCGVSSPVSMTHGGGWLTVTGVPVSQANDLLGASYQLYRHTSTNETILRTVGYALPAVLHAHVQTVAPTTYFSPPRTLQQTPRRRPREEATEMANATLGELVTVLSDRAQEVHVMPESLRRLYNTRAYVPVAMDRNVLGIAGYMGQSPSEEDLRMFMNTYRTEAKDATFTTMDVNNGKSDLEQSSVEASMNIQYAEGMAYPTPLIYYNIGGEVTWSKRTKKPKKGDSDLEWLNYVIKQPKAPQTISISYGNEEQGLPREYVTPLCNLFAQLGLRGVSVLVSTGNDGVGEGDCKDASGKVQFVPYFPATCTCGVSSLLCNFASNIQARAQFAHQTATDLQVRMSLALVARRATPRSRRISPGVASHSTFRALPTRTTRCPLSSGSTAARMPAFTSTFTVVA